MAAIPIALCGKDPATCDGFVRGMLPEYDVVHVCHNAEAAIDELPRLFFNDSIKPTAGKGSNMGRSRGLIPEAIFVGGGFTEAEFENMRDFQALRFIPWMYPPASVRARGNGPPPAELVVAQAKKSLADNGLVPGRVGRPEPGIWAYGHEEIQLPAKSGQSPKL